jgi:hypothetical protein
MLKIVDPKCIEHGNKPTAQFAVPAKAEDYARGFLDLGGNRTCLIGSARTYLRSCSMLCFAFILPRNTLYPGSLEISALALLDRSQGIESTLVTFTRTDVDRPNMSSISIFRKHPPEICSNQKPSIAMQPR